MKNILVIAFVLVALSAFAAFDSEGDSEAGRRDFEIPWRKTVTCSTRYHNAESRCYSTLKAGLKRIGERCEEDGGEFSEGKMHVKCHDWKWFKNSRCDGHAIGHCREN